ncbi:AAA family ATPase [Thorsellia kenyensis]|uniref:AAA family ATPase n=1 Tax=Thorsellia kenyensis TaxID=1549888 RepID=A0ABV6C7U0_9GAMM
MYLNNIIIKNMGAIESFKLMESELFKENGDPKPIILIGQNGSGKTTLLSSIVDALYELSNNAFDDILPKTGSGYRYFKISGGVNIRVGEHKALAFVSFKNESDTYQYLDKNGELSPEECKMITNSLMTLDFNKEQNNLIKIATRTEDDDKFKNVFLKNTYCYFPSDRYEIPYWMNQETAREKKFFEVEKRFNGSLKKDILINHSLTDIKEWILNVILDARVDVDEDINGEFKILRTANDLKLLKISVKNIEVIVSEIVRKDVILQLNFRGRGASRIKLIEKESNDEFLPSLDNLSAGQSTLLSIFLNIIKYSDLEDLYKGSYLRDIKGIVIIDEIDLHLHIELQYEVLPALIDLFPKVQFIISSHSPFFLSGMARKFTSDNFLMLNMPNGNKILKADDFSEFSKVYDIFNNLTQSYKNELEKLQTAIQAEKKPLIITEGKTDWKHIKAAIVALKVDYQNLDVAFFEYEEDIKMGSSALKVMLEKYKMLKQGRKLIFIFDRDEKDIVKQFGTDKYKNLGNNVYAFCLPKLKNCDEPAIEHYYSEKDSKQVDKNGRRLFFSNEFHIKSAVSLDGNYRTYRSNVNKNNSIIDSDVFNSADFRNEKSIALSKADFASNIINKTPPFNEMDFSKFRSILDLIQEICNLQIDDQ